MATIRERSRKGGGVTYTVLWRDGGTRQGKQESERFGTLKEAEAFRGLVDLNHQKWPPGWVRGRGFVTVEPGKGKDMPLADWARRYVDRLNGVEGRTRRDYHRDIDNHIVPLFPADATVGSVTADHVADWVRAEEDGERDRATGEWLRKPASPKSIGNRHSLLYALFQAAVEAEPPLRTANPCSRTKLPRVDAGTEDEMVFLERDEWQRLRAELAAICRGDAIDLADTLIGTGMRWGEAAAIQVRDLSLTGATPTLRIQRAWKRQDDNTLRLGPPKTRKARRTLALSPGLVEIFRRNITGKAAEDFVFTTAAGNAWRHNNFYNRRWLPAVRAAKAAGFPKSPRIHDLRHTHVSWLIAANIPLPAIQARLGHESITTTVDRYGHLVRALDGEISAAVEAAMAAEGQSPGGLRLVSGS